MSSIIKPVLGSQLNLGHHLSKGLVGLWLLNEGSGTKVFDLSENGNTGTIQGDTRWSSGKYGIAWEGDGTGDYIDCGLSLGNIIGAADTFSLAIWFKSDNTNSNDGLFNIGPFASARGEFNVNIQANNIYTQINDNNFSQNFAFTDTGWNCLIVSWDSVTVKVFLNNVIKIDQAYSLATSMAGLKTIIGAYHSNNTPFDGKISHCYFYNRSLSASEIALLYREPFVMFERNPIELWVGSVGAAAAAGNPWNYYAQSA